MNDIAKVIDLVEEEVRQFREPIVTEVSHKRNPYQVLISCILSLRTKDETTRKASERLFQKAKTPEEMLLLTEEEIEKLIFPVGFYRVKARNIRKITKILIDDYKSQVPSSLDELLKLPGVGRKTANIALVFGFDKMGMPIDTHCHRIPNRIGWIKTKTPEQTEFELRELIPKSHWKKFNDVFVTFGQNICKPIKPLCSKCPVSEHCDYYERFVLPDIEAGKG